MRMLFKALVCGTLLAAVLSFTGFTGVCEEIRGDVFRLHIIANSDSEEDQALKLMVRDAVLGYTGELFRECGSKNDSVRCAGEHIDDIRRIASTVLKENGADETVDAYVTKMSFGTRVYDGVTLPAGEYDALRIVIGAGQGHNWWCVLFPALCLPGATGSEMNGVLSESEIGVVSGGEKYEIRFRIVEWLEGLFSIWR